MDQEDTQLVFRAKQEKGEFEFLYQKYTGKVYTYFWYRVGYDKEIAEDLMQQTFLKAFCHIQRFEIRGCSYLTYLLRIAHNVLVNYYRAPKAVSLSRFREVAQGGAYGMESIEDAKTLWQAVAQLNEVEQNALVLKYQKELSVREVSSIMKKSENAVKLILSRARKKLAKHPHLADFPLPQRQQPLRPKLRFGA